MYVLDVEPGWFRNGIMNTLKLYAAISGFFVAIGFLICDKRGSTNKVEESISIICDTQRDCKTGCGPRAPRTGNVESMILIESVEDYWMQELN